MDSPEMPFSAILSLLPPATALPVSSSLLSVLLLLTFYAHMLLVNILLGVLFQVLFNPRFFHVLLGERGHLPATVLALIINLGIPPFLFLQVRYGFVTYPSLILAAVWWLFVVLLIILAYYGLHIVEDRTDRVRGVCLAVGGVLLLAVAFLLTNGFSLVQRPDLWPQWLFSSHGMLVSLADPSLLPRYAHTLVASVAVGGLVMAWLAHRSRSMTQKREREQCLRRGLGWFMSASLIQIPIGLLYLFSLPEEVTRLFLGGSLLATGSLVLGVVGLTVVLFLAWRGRLMAVSAVTAGIILIMVCMRGLARTALLAPYQEHITVVDLVMPRGQGLVLTLFLICAVLTVGVVGWMLRTVMSARSVPRATQSGEES